MPQIKKVFCRQCGKTFYKDTGHYNENLKLGNNFYCSKPCVYKFRIKQKPFICENPDCKKLFNRIPSAISSSNFCSSSCAAKINNSRFPKRKPIFKNCPTCNKKFRTFGKGTSYCSRICHLTNQSVERKHTKDELINNIRSKYEELGRVPAKREVIEIFSACVNKFGSWNNAIKTAGLEPNRSHDNRMYKRVTAKAKDGHICDSVSEALIDNWLTENKIQHVKGVAYPNSKHKADWGINDGRIFVEYFGLAKDSPRYDRAIRKKKYLCKKYKIKLIEVYPQDIYPKINLYKNLHEKFAQFI